jgi:hypothetical protein
MASPSLSIGRKIAERDSFLMPALGVSIGIVGFVVVTQLLAASGAISLDATQQFTMWLVAVGLIVLLWIAYMAVEAQARLAAALLARADPPSAPVPEKPIDGPDPSEPVPPKDGKACPRLPVNMEDVFPQGCYLVPDSISETFDYDEKTRTRRPAIHKITGQRVYRCRVVDMDPELKGRSRETAVMIVADQMPVPPTGAQYEPVKFEGLTSTPHPVGGGRAAYASLCATGIEQAIARPAPGAVQVPAPTVDSE